MAGKKETVSLAIQKAERFRTELLRRGVLLVPVIWGEGREPQMEKKGFGLPSKAAAALPSIGVRSRDSPSVKKNVVHSVSNCHHVYGFT